MTTKLTDTITVTLTLTSPGEEGPLTEDEVAYALRFAFAYMAPHTGIAADFDFDGPLTPVTN